MLSRFKLLSLIGVSSASLTTYFTFQNWANQIAMFDNKFLNYFKETQIEKESELLREHVFNQYKLKTRAEHLKEVTENPNFDILIVGGGATGSGAALSSSAVGLKTLIIDSHDFGTGASSKSSKLIHGGVRYFQNIFSFSLTANRRESYNLVKKAVSERENLINNAPHLTRYLGIVLPTRGIFQTVYYWIGMKMYYFMCSVNKNHMFQCPSPRIMYKSEMDRYFPLLAKKYRYGIVYYDGQMDDTRINIESILTSTVDNYVAGWKGSNALNYARLEQILKNKEGKIIGAIIMNKVTGKTFEVKCKAIVNATGPGSDTIRIMNDVLSKKRLICSRGTHVVLNQSFCAREFGLLIPNTSDGRILFILPWLQGTIVGTTDEQVPIPHIHPIPQIKDIDMIYNNLLQFYPKLEDIDFDSLIQSQWAGLRPLVLSEDAMDKYLDSGEINTASISRDHVVETHNSGLISIMGGKWTTYREMGEDGINAVLEYFKENNLMSDEEIQIKKANSSKYLRLIGDFRKHLVKAEYSEFYKNKDYHRFLANSIMRKDIITDMVQANYLSRRYGRRAFDILDIIEKDKKQADKIHPETQLCKAEIKMIVQQEMVVSPLDILLRRTRIGFTNSELAKVALPQIVEIMGQELGWSNSAKKNVYEETLATLEAMQFGAVSGITTGEDKANLI